MSHRDSTSNFLTGLLVGLGAACAGMLLYDLGRRARQGAFDGERRPFPLQPLPVATPRKIRKAGRELTARVERMRTAGH